jgi:hypothetical protein
MIDTRELLGVEKCIYQRIIVRGSIGLNRSYGKIFPEVQRGRPI